jgi:hypothetical protein
MSFYAKLHARFGPWRVYSRAAYMALRHTLEKFRDEGTKKIRVAKFCIVTQLSTFSSGSTSTLPVN